MRNGWGNGWNEQRRFEGSRMGGGMSGREPMREGPERGRGHFLEEGPGRFERGMRERGTREDPSRESYGRELRSDDETWLSRGEAPIVKVIEVVAQSPHSWEDAARRAVTEASRTIHDIKSIWVKDMQAIVTHDRVVEFRLVAKISFAIHSEQRRGGRDTYA